MTIKYKVSIQDAHQQYLQIEAWFPVLNETTEIKLPVWRPGRYELGNFAKNVKGFEAFDDKGKKIETTKKEHSIWEVASKGLKTIRVRYQYYANELNAGSTFLSKEQLYINPVNCLCYTDQTIQNECELELNVPEEYTIACQLTRKESTLFAKNFDQLADSPLIASPTLEHGEYEVKGYRFHVWIQGMENIEWERLLKDFTTFTTKQIQKFSEFPVPEYHFLIQIVPYKAYHGVEHCASTVILLGPTYDVFKQLYPELLGVCSHELYHTWNVKAIRPIEMAPYDFSKPNYSPLGYLCEGVTTYMGDLLLWKSGLFSDEAYYKEFGNQLQKHFDNPGRFNSSVVLSSLETWLDGYVAGAPGRKVSIYTEGCLLAFMTDVRLMQDSLNKYRLDDVMKHLYQDYYLHGKAVSEDDYFEVIEVLSQTSWDEWRKDFFHGCKGYEAPLVKALEYLGLELVHTPSKLYKEAKTGIKTLPTNMGEQIIAIYPGSPADMAGLMLDDQIIAINSKKVNGDLEEWLRYHDHDNKKLTVVRKGEIIECLLPELNRFFYNTYSIKPTEKPSPKQVKSFNRWKK